MERYIDSLQQPGGAWFPVLWASLALLALAVIVLAQLHIRAQRRWGKMLHGAQTESLDAIFEAQLAERDRLAAMVESLTARVKALEESSRSAKRYVGLVRFDAFEDVGGLQSFALAVMDDRGDGAVLSSIVGRDVCRVFAKPLVGGRSERELSGEERRAIRDAMESGPRSLVSA